MPTVTKRRRASKRPAEPPAVPAVNLEPRGIEIYPELMEFDAGLEAQFLPGDPKPYTVDIREHDGRKPHAGRRLFTVTIDPLLSAASARRIAALIDAAPELWRIARKDNRYRLCDDGVLPMDFADYIATHELLFLAADNRQPYEPPEDDVDESIYNHQMERDRQLADPAWRKAMVSKFIRIEDRSNAGAFGVAFHCNVIPTCTFCTLLPEDMAAHLRDKHGVQIDTPAQEGRP